MSGLPSYDADLFTDEALAEPYGHLQAIRDAGPVVRLTAHDLHAVARHRDVRTVLDDDETYRSGEGVGLNEVVNELGRGTTLMSDGDEHQCQREIIGRPLTPKSLADLQPEAQALADALVDRLLEAGSFDAVGDLAEALPARWVPDLLGWPTEGRDRLLAWGSDNFDALGPPNGRAKAAGPGLMEMAAYAQHLAGSELAEGSMAARILEAADRGEIDRSRCPMLIIDYLAPSLDTTVSAIGNAVWLLATHPDQWDLLRSDPTRVKHAVNEALRLESPLSSFTRVAATDTELDGTPVPAGTRLLVSYASANRDERQWVDPERFDITRDSAGHLAFGHGVHACAGMGLARLEAAAVLRAVAERVERLELAGPPERKLNNLIRSFASVPVTVRPA